MTRRRRSGAKLSFPDPRGTTDVLRRKKQEPAATDEALARAPDYVGPLIGWRLWEVEDVHRVPRLRSLYRMCFWPVGSPLAARCNVRGLRLWRAPHRAPVADCRCGIYAVPFDFVSTLAFDEILGPPRRTVVIGEVAVWGDVVECEHGLRAGFAYPERLFVPSACSNAKRAVVGLEDYGVPVELVDAPTMAAAVGVISARVSGRAA
jgi:hypothetical protein